MPTELLRRETIIEQLEKEKKTLKIKFQEDLEQTCKFGLVGNSVSALSDLTFTHKYLV
jgi:hypothetical protein